MRIVTVLSGLALLWTQLATMAAAREPMQDRWLPNPFPRAHWVGKELHRWDFDNDAEGFTALNDCSISTDDGVMRIKSTGNDPFLQSPIQTRTDAMVVRLRMRQKTGGGGQLFWASDKHQRFAKGRSVAFKLIHDGQWHEYEVPLAIDGHLTALRLDPGTAAGEIEVDWVAIYAGGLHTLEITRFTQHAEAIDMKLHNHGSTDRQVQVNDQTVSVPAGQGVNVTIDLQLHAKLTAQTITVTSPGLSAITRTVWVHVPAQKAPAERLTVKGVALEVTQDGSMATIARRGKTVAVIAPIVHRNHAIPKLKLVRQGNMVKLHDKGISAILKLTAKGEVDIAIESNQRIEGPVVRTIGALEQGLLAGVEYLGKGEMSSSKLDIETSEHLRYEPAPSLLTMPLMAFVTDRATVAMTWDDMQLQPTFATPDFVDGTPHHRMSLRGKRIKAVLRVGPGWGEGGRLEEPILWAIGFT